MESEQASATGLNCSGPERLTGSSLCTTGATLLPGGMRPHCGVSLLANAMSANETANKPRRAAVRNVLEIIVWQIIVWQIIGDSCSSKLKMSSNLNSILAAWAWWEHPPGGRGRTDRKSVGQGKRQVLAAG